MSPPSPTDSDDLVLALRDVSVRFGRHSVLTRVSLDRRPGEVVGLRGPNGSGKTTLLRILAGVLRPSTGRREGRPRVAFMPIGVVPPTVSATQWLGGIRRGRTGWPEALDQLGFDGDRAAPCRVLSLGNFRKVLIADALTAGAEVVLIDEATVGLDERGRSGLLALVGAARSAGAAIVQSEQDAEAIPLASSTWRVEQGAVSTEHGAGLVTVSLRGPREHLADLLVKAQAAGFVREAGTP